MEYRKLISFGKNSFVVSLPKHWVRQNKLVKGDLISIDEKEDTLLLGTQANNTVQEEKSIRIPVDKVRMRQLKREIISAYINNNKTIVLYGEEIKTKAKELQKIIQSLVALEIMEQDSRQIVAKDFLNMNDVSTKSIVRKIDVITRSMFEDCMKMFEEDNYESIEMRDNDVNKLTFLMFRIIKYGLEDYTYMMKKLNLSAVELLGLWWLVFDLESAADELKRISRYMKIVKLDKKKEEEFLELLKRVKVNYLAMMKAYYDPNIKGVHEILNGREKLFNDIEEYYDTVNSMTKLDKIRFYYQTKHDQLVLVINKERFGIDFKYLNKYIKSKVKDE